MGYLTEPRSQGVAQSVAEESKLVAGVALERHRKLRHYLLAGADKILKNKLAFLWLAIPVGLSMYIPESWMGLNAGTITPQWLAP
jgi:hypothetical protein